MKKLWMKAASVLPAFALVLATLSTQNLCWFFYHQPDIPEELRDQ